MLRLRSPGFIGLSGLDKCPLTNKAVREFALKTLPRLPEIAQLVKIAESVPTIY